MNDDEIPLLVMLFYLFHDAVTGLFLFFIKLKRVPGSGLNNNLCVLKLRGRQRQVGSLAGAAHLLNYNTGVLRLAQWEQKSHVEQKGKS